MQGIRGHLFSWSAVVLFAASPLSTATACDVPQAFEKLDLKLQSGNCEAGQLSGAAVLASSDGRYALAGDFENGALVSGRLEDRQSEEVFQGRWLNGKLEPQGE